MLLCSLGLCLLCLLAWRRNERFRLVLQQLCLALERSTQPPVQQGWFDAEGEEQANSRFKCIFALLLTKMHYQHVKVKTLCWQSEITSNLIEFTTFRCISIVTLYLYYSCTFTWSLVSIECLIITARFHLGGVALCAASHTARRHSGHQVDSVRGELSGFCCKHKSTCPTCDFCYVRWSSKNSQLHLQLVIP